MVPKQCCFFETENAKFVEKKAENLFLAFVLNERTVSFDFYKCLWRKWAIPSTDQDGLFCFQIGLVTI